MEQDSYLRRNKKNIKVESFIKNEDPDDNKQKTSPARGLMDVGKMEQERQEKQFTS